MLHPEQFFQKTCKVLIDEPPERSVSIIAVGCGGQFVAHTYPMNFSGMTGLPCRVVAEIP